MRLPGKDLYAALPPRYHPLVQVAINTGLRKGELLRMRWEDIDWYAGSIKIRETKADQPRQCRMNSTVQRVLTELKELQAEKGSIFPFNARYLGRAFQRAVKRANLAPFRFHDLRHTFASRLAMLGVNDRTLKELGGWASTAMLDRYVHLSPSHCWQAVEQLTQFQTGTKMGTMPKTEAGQVARDRATY